MVIFAFRIRIYLIPILGESYTYMMLSLIDFPSSSEERSRLLSANFIRHRALERLYERRAAVENLIRSLEDYQHCSEAPQRAACIELTASGRCS